MSEAAVKKTDLRVLAMSATPVINNLVEGKFLIEMLTGIDHNELNTKPSIDNCIALYQKFVCHGVRWIPRYSCALNLRTENIDCGEFLDEIRDLHREGKSYRKEMALVTLEFILMKAKLPAILRLLKPKTIVYTHYVKNIVPFLKDNIERAGWRVALFTGEHKDGLKEFINSDADILIASSCAGTGIDGLQRICNRLIVSCLPWTHAEFLQLIGRVYRQGQQIDHVDVYILLTYAEINGEPWSWCESRWSRIQSKKTIADAAVDGIIPEAHVRTPTQAYDYCMKWFERLERGEINPIQRIKKYTPLAGGIE